MTAIQRVRKEYDEPFRDVVKGFGVMGYSRKATAETLRISKSYFNSLCATYNLDKHFKARKEYLPVCKPPGHKKGKRILQPQRYSDWYLLSILAGYSPRITAERFNQLQGKPCADTYCRRFGSWKQAKQLAGGKDEHR
jgi:hypothetical protein